MTQKDVAESRSLGQMIFRAAEAWPDDTAQLRRTNDGQFHPVTFSELLEEVYQAACALDNQGLKRGDRIALIAETSPDWAVVDWAAQTLGLVLVPIFPSLPPDQAQFLISDSGSKLVVAGDAALAKKTTGVPVLTISKSDNYQQLSEATKNSDLTLEELKSLTAEITSEETATIIYTSGTTGNPKGVELSHSAFTSLCDGIRQTLPFSNEDTFLSFLPMSHVFERFAGHVLPVSLGAKIAYAGSLATLGKDMQTVRPTIMLCVPRFLEATRAKILDGVRKQKPIARKLFGMALAQGGRKLEGQPAPMAGLLDKLVGQKIREKTGGRIRFFVSGGAALPPPVADFYRSFGLTVLQGYGLTETCAATCINLPDDNDPQTVGPPLKGVEVMIASDGEILVRGPSVMKGYYNLPKDTAEAIDADGWFHTGDIGEFDGAKVKITDRKKDLIVLANGKNVAPQPIEGEFRQQSLISEVVVFGDGCQCCHGLVIPDFAAVEATVEGAKGKSREEMAEDPAVKDAVKQQIAEVNKTLADYQRVKKHVLIPNELSVDSGELTPSLKVKRRVVKEKFADILAKLAG